MMPKIIFDLHLFESPKDIPRSRKTLLKLMEVLTQINNDWLINHKIPSLYKTRIIYKPERSTEIWKDIPSIMRDGFGDCEDLACWRIAELRNIGVMAKPYIKWTDKNGASRFHAVLLLPNGFIEDPSRSLGMSGHPITRTPVYVEP